MQLPPKVTNRAFDRLAEIIPASSEKGLRIAVEGGGCSGFKYNIDYDNQINDDDFVISQETLKIIIDPISLQFLNGSVIDYKSELVGSRFVIENPNAVSSCGCGTSFSI